MEYRKGRHVVYMLHAHLVFVTKYRGRVFNQQHLQFLEQTMRSICDGFEVDLREFNGERDHVHLLVEYPPKVRLSELVNSLKGASSRRFKQKFPQTEKFWSVARSGGALWSPSYFAGSVGGAPLSVLREYIKRQSSHV